MNGSSIASIVDSSGRQRRIVHHQDLAVLLAYAVGDGRRGDDQVKPELALQPLLRDLHVQQAEKSRAKAEAQRLRGLRLEYQARVVEPQLFDRLAQRAVLVGFGRIKPREHHRLEFLEPRQRLARRIIGVGDGVAHAHVGHGLDLAATITDFARSQLLRPRPRTA